jgi:S-adenosylmethionine:tRNA ribosyltransferase-isomerase
MRTDILDYPLPVELIAQKPAQPRDSSRLLLCPRYEGPFEIHTFRDLPDLLKLGDVIVTNSARVMPARLFGYKHPSGARIEVFLLERLPDDAPNPRFKALLRRRRRLEQGDCVLFPESRMVATVVTSDEEVGEDIVELSGVEDVAAEIERIGRIPLPPYVRDFDGDVESYQTIFAKISGSVAAPTAGLHFTPEVLKRLEDRGVGRVEGYLRVGWGTFSPIRTERLEDHELHSEFGVLTSDAASELNSIRNQGGRIIAVGTTMTRLLETAVDDGGVLHEFRGSTAKYITPGYEFKAIDGLLTNFHLPRTSLLALVAAFTGVERILEAYRFAVENRFRFYSFGDAMLIV